MGIDPVKRRAVFLDRDGVLNRAIVRDGMPFSPTTLAEFELLPDAEAAVERLRRAGFHLVVTTNQPEVARGRVSREVLASMHAVLTARLGIGDVRVCPHDDRDACPCRKPKPGMLLAAAADANLDLASSFMVGDRWRDVAAGRSAGAHTVLIDYHYADTHPVDPEYRATSITDAVTWILQHDQQAR
jgi:D-glycero-D-manno-heptose 1,7-bisphosphate phosphatase